jgi:hypothetical protein
MLGSTEEYSEGHQVMPGIHWATIVCFKKSLFLLMMGDNIKMQGDDEDFWSHQGNAKWDIDKTPRDVKEH